MYGLPVSKISLEFPAKDLLSEVTMLTEWHENTFDFPGTLSVGLINSAEDGKAEQNTCATPTEQLNQCLGVISLLFEVNAVYGRCSIIHVSKPQSIKFASNYVYRRNRRTVISVLSTDSAVKVSVGDDSFIMHSGECWQFDTSKLPQLDFEFSDETHLLIFDTVGSGKFWFLVDNSESPFDKTHSIGIQPIRVSSESSDINKLRFECNGVDQYCQTEALESIVLKVLERLGGIDRTRSNNKSSRKKHFDELTRSFLRDWRYTVFEWHEIDSIARSELLKKFLSNIKKIQGSIKDVYGKDIKGMVTESLENWCDQHGYESTLVALPESIEAPAYLNVTKPSRLPVFERPIFILSAPRSGSTLLYETLANNKGVWTLDGEGHNEVESITNLNPLDRNYDSNCLTHLDADSDVREKLLSNYCERLRNSKGEMYYSLSAEGNNSSIRFLEKTPKNALRIGFFDALFPDAKFIYLFRDPSSNIASILEGWKSDKFKLYPNLPDWVGTPWSFALIPGWRNYINKPVEEVSAHQWVVFNQYIIDYLSKMESTNWTMISYDDLISNTPAAIERLCNFSDIHYGKRMQQVSNAVLPESRYTLTSPNKDKWKIYEKELLKMECIYSDLFSEIQSIYFDRIDC